MIDTGLDTDHQSFSPSAFAYALDQASKEKGIAYQLLDAEEIGSVMKQLNAYQRATGSGQSLSAADLYINNSKAAFGYNYIDGDLDVTHDHDDQGEHGSHVAGIAAANRYLEQDGAYVDAMEEVQVAGNAPDAQLLVMKVFGKNGGAFDSDIMVAIEDRHDSGRRCGEPVSGFLLRRHGNNRRFHLSGSDGACGGKRHGGCHLCWQ